MSEEEYQMLKSITKLFYKPDGEPEVYFVTEEKSMTPIIAKNTPEIRSRLIQELQ